MRCAGKFEVFHKILKSGCRVEESRLRTAERRVRLVAVCCIVSWRIFWMTMMNRTHPHAPAGVAFTRAECELLDELFPSPAEHDGRFPLAQYLLCVARLGGYLAPARDPVPGNIVMWRGLSRIHDLSIGYALHCGFVGN